MTERSEDALESLSHLRAEEIDRLAEMSRMTDREWKRVQAVTELSEEEWTLLTEGVGLVRSIQTVGRLTRWFVMGMVGFFIGVFGLVEVIVRVKAMLSGVPK